MSRQTVIKQSTMSLQVSCGGCSRIVGLTVPAWSEQLSGLHFRQEVTLVPSASVTLVVLHSVTSSKERSIL